MKMLGKFTAALLAAAAALCSMPAAAFAAGEVPRIVLNASGIEGQYILRLEDFGSRFESVQFDILVEGSVAAPQVVWQDDSPAHFQQVIDRQENGKTVLTVYIDRLRPIASSGSVNLASLTFSQNIPAAAFSAGSELLALDEHQEETFFSSPAFSVTGAAAGGGSAGASSSSSSEGTNTSSGSASFDREPDSSDSSGSKYSSGEKTVLSWEDVSGEKTGEIDGKKGLSIRVLEGQVISAEIFRRAQQQGMWLSLDYGDFIWLFDTSKGLNIPAGRIFYDLAVKPVQFRSLSAAVEGSDLLQFEIAYSGVLPCPATLSCRVGSGYAGETVHLSCYNENEATLDFQESAQVEENGKAEFAFTHASRYVVSEKNLWEVPAQPAAGTVTAAAASPVIVAPEDEMKDDDSSEPEAAEEPKDSSSAPEPSEEEDSGGEEEEAPSGADRRWDANIVPLVLLFLSAAAAAILFLEMRASKKRRYRR